MTKKKEETVNNLELWEKVEKTNPAHTKKANVRGNKITAIAPQTQIMSATEQFGPYGQAWGFKSIAIDCTLVTETGLVLFEGIFYFPQGEFPIITSTSVYRDGARTSPDHDFAKKVETDALTKALSKLGFNADIFMGRYDDVKYFNEVTEEFKEKVSLISDEQKQELVDLIEATNTNTKAYLANINASSLDNISADNFDSAKGALLNKQNRMAAMPETNEKQA